MLLFRIVTVTLVDLGAVFWVGVHIWRVLLLSRRKAEPPEQSAIYEQVERRFDYLFSLLTLLLLLLANLGRVVSQALLLTGGRWDQTFFPALLRTLFATGF